MKKEKNRIGGPGIHTLGFDFDIEITNFIGFVINVESCIITKNIKKEK